MPHTPHPQTIIDRTRKGATKLANALTANAARWVIGWSLGLAALYLTLGWLTLVPSSLLPTVLTLALGLLLAASAVVAPVPERMHEARRGLRLAIVGLVACTVALTLLTASDSSRQTQRATARCLATAAQIAPASSRRPSPSGPSLRSRLAAFAAALCDVMAAGRS